MNWIAQASDGDAIYYMVMDNLDGIYLGVGWEVLSSEAEMLDRWPGLPAINIDDPPSP